MTSKHRTKTKQRDQFNAPHTHNPPIITSRSTHRFPRIRSLTTLFLPIPIHTRYPSTVHPSTSLRKNESNPANSSSAPSTLSSPLSYLYTSLSAAAAGSSFPSHPPSFVRLAAPSRRVCKETRKPRTSKKKKELYVVVEKLRARERDGAKIKAILKIGPLSLCRRMNALACMYMCESKQERERGERRRERSETTLGPLGSPALFRVCVSSETRARVRVWWRE